MNIDRLMSALNDFVDESGLLTHYRSDLGIDRATLSKLKGWPVFVWAVGETFTHLAPVGMHASHNEWIEAFAHTRGPDPSVHWCLLRFEEGNFIEEVSLARIVELAKQPTYRIKDGFILGPNGKSVGKAKLDLRSRRGNTPACYIEVDEVGVLPRDHLFEIASAEVASRHGLWCPVVDVEELVQAAHQAA